MRVLVTGATGFVGLNVVDDLVDDHAVVALTRRGAPDARLPDGVETVAGGIGDREAVEAAVADVDAVVHLAAAVYPGPDMRTVNVDGTETVLDAADAAGVDRVVFTSTIGAHPEVPTDPDSEYQTSKVACEELFFDRDRDFAFSVLYPTYILGPRDYRLTRYEPFKRAASNRVLVPPLYTYDDYNVVHVEDVVGTVDHCLTAPDPEERYVVSGPNVTNMQFLRTTAEAAGGHCRVVDVPYALAKYGIVPVIDFLHRRGVSPVAGSGFVERGDFGTLREGLTERAPVRQRSWQSALVETANWYREVGLL